MFAVLLVLTAPTAEPLAVAPPPRLVGELAVLVTPTGKLHGTIDLPAGQGPWPVVLIHPGSGPTNRDGNSAFTRTDNLKMLGRALAAEGIAVLRIDKRGVAASLFALEREEELLLDTYAADVAAWVAQIRRDPRFTKVGYIGHSEGALIGLLIARDAKFDAFVSLCGPGRPLQDVVREQLKESLSEELYKKADATLGELAAGRTVKDTPKDLELLFRPSVQPYLISVFRQDPAKLIAGLGGPILIVSGSTDIQVTETDGKRLAEANPKAKAVTVKGMNHVLKAIDKTDRAVQLPSYADPSLPLHPRLMVEIGGFLKQSLGAGGR